MTDQEFMTQARAGFPPPAPPKPALMLPVEMRLALQSAAKVKDSFERAKAIDRVTERARLLHPQLFR